MTRHRTFLPRGSTAQCAVCEVGVGGSGFGRARCDCLGQLFCAKHGQTARRFTEKKLLDLQPSLANLFRQRKDLTFLKTMLDPSLVAQIVRYPPSGRPAATTLPFLLPYQRVGPRKRHRRRRKAEPHSTTCGLCLRQLCGEGRRQLRPWGDRDFCRKCHARVARQDDRAAAQFDALVTFVRRSNGCWVLPLLSPILQKRVVRYLARVRPAPVPLDPARFV